VSHPFDWISVPVLLVSGYVGYRRGFLEEVARFVELIIATLISIRFYGILTGWLKNYLAANDVFLRIISFLVILLICLFVIRYLTRWIQDAILDKGVDLANNTVGFLFGLLRGCLIILLLLWLVEIVPTTKTVGDFRERSYLFNHLSGYREWVMNYSGIEPFANKSEKWFKKKLDYEVPERSRTLISSKEN
jgi:membrane protein required for colicin V production